LDFRRLKYSLQNLQILIVSSDLQLAAEIAQILTSETYNCIVETSGEKAWEIILQIKPVIVVADWAIDDISGLALCHLVKSNLAHPELMDTYFVLIVEAVNAMQRQIGLDTGADEFLASPIDPSELKSRLRTGVRISALTQSLIWTNQRLLANGDLLESLTLCDPLTKVLSESAFEQVIPTLMRQFQGQGNYKDYVFLSVLIIDIDQFKHVSQSYGGRIGDETIKAIAGRLSHACAAQSLLYRHGLDEFVCVTPHLEPECGEQLANDLLSSIRSHPIAVSSGLLFPLTVSIGGVVKALNNQKMASEPFDISVGELVSLSEQFLLQAQQSGGDRAYIEAITNSS
jgi:two-component system, cell cycle response regulator